MKHVFLICLLTALNSFLKGQSINTEFGKNRVQYHEDFKNWWQYETENFIVYWYGKGRNVAQAVIQLCEYDHDEVQRVLEHRMNDKIEIIVYTDVTDLKQSNIGTEESFVSRTGETKIVGNKMFVYFDGDHALIRKKIREGIANVYLNNMLFGSNIQEIIQNAVLLDIPEWYKQGMVAYAASNWDIQIENELRDIWHTKAAYRNFNKLKEINPKVAGHSFWFFIEQQYGKSTISNLLYLSKISRGINNSFEYILNTDLTALIREWEKFYRVYFSNEENRFRPLSDANTLKLYKKRKVNPEISQIQLSPDGRYLLYVLNDRGKCRVQLLDLEDGTKKTILKYGYVNTFQETDYNYPLIAWHPSKPEISLLYDRRDILYLRKYKLGAKTEYMEQEIPTIFQRIYSISYVNDLDYVFAANTDGFSDLYYYKSKNRNHDRITQDFYDDLDAVYYTLNGKPGILFSTNRDTDSIREMRRDTILPLGNFDLCFVPLDNPDKKAVFITRTADVNERSPQAFTDKSIVFLSDKSGIRNAYVINTESGEIKAISNHSRHLQRHHATPTGTAHAAVYSMNGVSTLHLLHKEPGLNAVPPVTEARQLYLSQTNITNDMPPLIFNPEVRKDTIERLYFQSPFPDPEILEEIDVNTEESPRIRYRSFSWENTVLWPKRVEPYNNTRAIAANKKFSLHNITTNFNNDILFEGLESYTGDRQQLLTTPMGFLVKATVKDLFEDYIVEAGMRIPTTFNGSEYFLVFDNRKKRLDKRMALYRKSNEYASPVERPVPALQRSKKTTTLGMYQLRYPFDIYRSIRATSTLRFDRFLRLSTEQSSFEAPVGHEKRLSLRLEYIYDNSYEQSMNIRRGTRYKFYSEFINEFDLQFIDGFAFDLSRGTTGILGFDARHYIPVLNKSVLALRMCGATSFGSKRMLYYLGGMENWIFPRFDMSIPERQDADFAYKANIFQMRGFDNNIRNGASFLVSNAELRIPFVQYLLGSRKGSAFFRNMQLTAFIDAGLAWYGRTPFSQENPLNKVQISAPPLIDMEIEYFRDPLVMGYGVGFRTRLLGYFVKLDYAYGIETRRVQDPKLYISFGLDF